MSPRTTKVPRSPGASGLRKFFAKVRLNSSTVGTISEPGCGKDGSDP